MFIYSVHTTAIIITLLLDIGAGGERTYTLRSTVREPAMDYAACNVVYVDRTAKEDKLAKRKDSIFTNPIENHSGDGEVTPVIAIPTSSESNLRALLETFSEGKSLFSPTDTRLTFYSSRLHNRQILYIQNLRIEPIFHCRINTYPRAHRHPLR